MAKPTTRADFPRAALSYLALYPTGQIITIALRPGDQLPSTSLALIPRGVALVNFRVLLCR